MENDLVNSRNGTHTSNNCLSRLIAIRIKYRNVRVRVLLQEPSPRRLVKLRTDVYIEYQRVSPQQFHVSGTPLDVVYYN